MAALRDDLAVHAQGIGKHERDAALERDHDDRTDDALRSAPIALDVGDRAVAQRRAVLDDRYEQRERNEQQRRERRDATELDECAVTHEPAADRGLDLRRDRRLCHARRTHRAGRLFAAEPVSARQRTGCAGKSVAPVSAHHADFGASSTSVAPQLPLAPSASA